MFSSDDIFGQNTIKGNHGDSDALKTMLIDETYNVKIGKSSVIGSRPSQQDTIVADDDYAFTKNGKGIAVLCDGMGGLAGGEKASMTCATTIYENFHLCNGIDIREFYKRVIHQADMDVKILKDEKGNPLNAGTTMVSVVLSEDNLYWASVGDSRIYIIRDSNIVCITTDHNYLMILNKMVERGEISLSTAVNHSQKEALVSFIGMGGVRFIDRNVKPFKLMPGDIIVMCSDGLYRTLSEDEIKKIACSEIESPQRAADSLTAAAINKNKRNQDNTSVIVVSFKN